MSIYHTDNKSQNVLAVIEEQLSESVTGIRDDFFAPDSVYVTTEVFEDHKVGEETNHEVWIGSVSDQGRAVPRKHTLALSDTNRCG